MAYRRKEFMNDAPTALAQPLAYRVWEPQRGSFFYTDIQPGTSSLVDRWTGLFDKQGLPIYENDIIRVHYNWKFGWVRAQVLRDVKTHEYRAQATAKDGTVLRIGYYCFADSYRLGNCREHPGKLTAASEQFAEAKTEPWWLSATTFRTASGSSFN